MRKLILAATLLLAACSGGDKFSDSIGPVSLAAKPISSVAPSVSIADVTCSESVGNCLVTITKDRAKSYSKISVVTTDGTARAGSDYTAVNLSLTMGNNSTSTTVSIPILPDALVEGSEKFTVSIKSVRNAVIARSPATVTITDATTTPVPTISVVPTSVNENAGSVTIHITRSGDLTGTTTFTWATQDGTAVHGVNYTASSGGRSFGPGSGDLTISVPVIDDGVYHSDVAFDIVLTQIIGGTLGKNDSITVKNVEAAPTTKTCADGSVIASTATCPTPDQTPPTTTPTTTTNLAGLDPVSSGFDPATSIAPSAFPPPNTNDTLGAFRFICGAGQLLYDDPIMHPGQPGTSHLHQFYGNTSANGNSTYSSLRASGVTTCGDPAQNAANRSAYWIPALLDGLGHVVQPDYVTIYYKRYPANSSECTSGLRGTCVALPRGLRFIFGRDMMNLSAPKTGNPYFLCDNNTGNFPTLQQALAVCSAGHHIDAVIDAPMCWDGVHLDTADHRSHMSYMEDSHMGYPRCPTTHPYIIPGFLLGANYLVIAGEDTSKWHYSSDEAAPTEPAGATYHADWFGAWDDTVMGMWTDFCINQKLNCSSGLLGNGYALKGADQPRYLIGGVLTPSWTNPNRLVNVPAHP
jgi:hypothetical protein